MENKWSVCPEKGDAENNLDRPGSLEGKPALAIKLMNIPNGSDASRNTAAGERSQDGDSAEIQRLMEEVAAEMHVDAERAIEDLKKDTELWNRVQRLKTERNGKTRDTDGNNIEMGTGLMI